jgi:flagellar hook protein FlgE
MAFPIAPPAATSALSGIRAASERLDTAAANVVSEMTGQGADTVSLSAESRAAAGGPERSGDIVQSMTDLRIAKYQNAASIAVLRTSDEMTQELVKLGKR